MGTVLGQYLDINTPLHRMNPITKMIGLVIMMTVALMFNTITAYLIQISVLIFILIITRMPLSILGKSLWSVRFIFIFIFIFNMLFLRQGTPIWQFGFLALYPETLIITSNLVLRLLLLTSYATLLTLTTKPLDLTYAIEQMLKPFGNLGHVVGMILSIALRFIPTLQEEAYKIMSAQQSRGATFNSGGIMARSRHLVSLLIPLFIISFARAETLAVAMELRGYNPDGVRTHYHVLTWNKIDVTAFIFLGIYLAVALAMKIYY